MKTPISTLIINPCNTGRRINWTGEGAVWVDANSNVEVPYDVWSKADRKQRESIIADCRSKRVELLLRVVKADGQEIFIGYDPSVLFNPVAHTETAEAPVKQMQDLVDVKQHNIVVKGDAAKSAEALGIETESVLTAVERPGMEDALYGFKKETVRFPTETQEEHPVPEEASAEPSSEAPAEAPAETQQQEEPQEHPAQLAAKAKRSGRSKNLR